MIAADATRIAGDVIQGVSLLILGALGYAAVRVGGRTLRVTEAAAKATLRDVQRRRLERVLDMVVEIRVLARRLYERDTETLDFVRSDEAALIPLQVALVALRTYLEAFPADNLPKVRELAKQGVRRADDADRIWGTCCVEAFDDVEAALRALGD